VPVSSQHGIDDLHLQLEVPYSGTYKSRARSNFRGRARIRELIQFVSWQGWCGAFEPRADEFELQSIVSSRSNNQPLLIRTLFWIRRLHGEAEREESKERGGKIKSRISFARGDGERMVGHRAVPNSEVIPSHEWGASASVEDAEVAERNEVQVPACDRCSASSASEDEASEGTAASSFANEGDGHRHAGDGVERAAGSVARAHEEILPAVVPGRARYHSFHCYASQGRRHAQVRHRLHHRFCCAWPSRWSSC